MFEIRMALHSTRKVCILRIILRCRISRIFNYVSVSENGLEDILPYISNKQVRCIYTKNCTLKNFRPMPSIYNLYKLEVVDGTSLTSLDGIEELDSLVEIFLMYCPNITDYTALLKLPRLERLIVTPEMIDRALMQLEGAEFKVINGDDLEW